MGTDPRLEYSLIQKFRSQHGASVDKFHLFLVSMRGLDGAFWALIATLLSVQCRDSVALDATKALMCATLESKGARVVELMARARDPAHKQPQPQPLLFGRHPASRRPMCVSAHAIHEMEVSEVEEVRMRVHGNLHCR